MKRIVYLFVALLMMATADAQTLTERQKRIGGMGRLSSHSTSTTCPGLKLTTVPS